MLAYYPVIFTTPNGKGCIVGTLDGNCSFYDIIDKRLQSGTHTSVMSRKKWPSRITGFQFCPTDSRKVIVSSADSQVRVLCGINVVGKFKGNRHSEHRATTGNAS
ncbi:WD repeat-containing protein 44-like [Helianthus annuus]|uniref:WD repeat-containing protein 44-like n=1 Tax=Helianthus annuus TaxID=4232 RepID=UPI001652D07F|nr:WD repeat-containing protein 44-like [Helianthus annuus]